MPALPLISSSPLAGTLTPSRRLPPPPLLSLPIRLPPSLPPPSHLSSKPRLRPHRPPPVRVHIDHDRNSNDDALEAVVEVLQQFGASAADALNIATGAPKYVEVLVENVRELDEHSLWSSWDAEGERDSGGLSFREKVCRMARRKGDNGILPLLESVGLKHSSAMLIARYLATEALPELIEKVKFVKEMLFSACDRKAFVGRNARRMMMHLSVSVDEDIQRTLSFFEKMEAGHGRLDMLGYEDASFPYLVESFPRLLLCSVENHLKPMIDFLDLIGVPKESIGTIILLFPPIIFWDIDKDIKHRMHALEKAGVEDRNFGRMLLKYPWILSESIQENYKSIITFFNEKKVPKSSVDLAIRSWPHLLGCSTRRMNAILDRFNELGVNRKMLVPVITSSPQLLLKKPHEFLEVVTFMEDVGFDGKTIGRILCRSPEIFAANVENTLRNKVEFLTDFGISSNRIPKVIRKYPELFLLDINDTLLPRMRYLMEIGLSQKEVCSMLCRFSPLLGYSIDVVLKPKLEFLLNTMGKPLKEIVEYPRYFSYSLEKKIKPRFWVLKSRNLECNLKDMLGKNDEAFAEVYMGIGRMLVTPPPVSHSDNR